MNFEDIFKYLDHLLIPDNSKGIYHIEKNPIDGINQTIMTN